MKLSEHLRNNPKQIWELVGEFNLSRSYPNRIDAAYLSEFIQSGINPDIIDGGIDIPEYEEDDYYYTIEDDCIIKHNTESLESDEVLVLYYNQSIEA